MAKVRVYELAKELGKPSKEILETLKKLGEYVGSASSTIEPPVVRKVRAAYADADASEGAGKAESPKSRASRSAPKAKAKAEAGPAVETSAKAPVTPAPKPEARRAAPKPAAPRPSAPRPGDSAPAAPTPRPVAPKRPAPTPGSGATRPRPPAPRDGRPGSRDARPGAPKRPGPSTPGRRPAGKPRPGNNPFAPSQGMGTQRRRPESRDDRQSRPAGGGGMPRPGGTSGMPRPNPGMMPKQQKSPLGGPQGGRGQRTGWTSGRTRSERWRTPWIWRSR